MFKVLSIGAVCLTLLASAVVADEPLRDPTRPLDYGTARVTVNLTLNAVLHGGERRVAVINGQRLREGAVISGTGGVRVESIDSAGVLVRQNDRRWRLTLNNQSVRQ